jgi:hypothetical protein
MGGPKPIVPNSDNGDYLMNNDIHLRNGPNIQKADIIKKMLDEILTLLNPIEYGFSELSTLQPKYTMEILYRFEEMFADEISALYYFNLYFDYEWNNLTSYPVRHDPSTNGTKQFPISAKPKVCLLSIFQNDKEPLISEWFNGWMQDIDKLQKKVSEAIDRLKRANLTTE